MTKDPEADPISGPIEVSAPGKLFLVGEYAVIDGAPAVLTAVDRRVHVTLEPASAWAFTAPALGYANFELTADGHVPATATTQARHDLRVFQACRAECDLAFGLPGGAFRVVIDSQAFTADGHKLGLGSSAAVTVALCQAFATAAGQAVTQQALTDLAIRAHRRAQDGRGSGGDVAVSVHGGLIRYQADQPTQALVWPGALKAIVLATGTGASTTELVARVQAYAAAHPSDYARLMGVLNSLAETATQATTSADSFLTLCRDYFAALTALDGAAGAGIVTDTHRRLADWAADDGVVFKSCGAGGGDVGLAFANANRLGRPLSDVFHDGPGRVVPLSMNADGARVEQASASGSSVQPL